MTTTYLERSEIIELLNQGYKFSAMVGGSGAMLHVDLTGAAIKRALNEGGAGQSGLMVRVFKDTKLIFIERD